MSFLSLLPSPTICPYPFSLLTMGGLGPMEKMGSCPSLSSSLPAMPLWPSSMLCGIVSKRLPGCTPSYLCLSLYICILLYIYPTHMCISIFFYCCLFFPSNRLSVYNTAWKKHLCTFLVTCSVHPSHVSPKHIHM